MVRLRQALTILLLEERCGSAGGGASEAVLRALRAAHDASERAGLLPYTEFYVDGGARAVAWQLPYPILPCPTLSCRCRTPSSTSDVEGGARACLAWRLVPGARACSAAVCVRHAARVVPTAAVHAAPAPLCTGQLAAQCLRKPAHSPGAPRAPPARRARGAVNCDDFALYARASWQSVFAEARSLPTAQARPVHRERGAPAAQSTATTSRWRTTSSAGSEAAASASAASPSCSRRPPRRPCSTWRTAASRRAARQCRRRPGRWWTSSVGAAGVSLPAKMRVQHEIFSVTYRAVCGCMSLLRWYARLPSDAALLASGGVCACSAARRGS